MEGQLVYLLLLIGSYGVSAMYDGQPTSINKVPYMGIVYQNDGYICVGTIIGDSWLVTIANSVKGVPVGDLTVRVGAADAFTGVVYNVKQVVVHPKHKNLDYNFALINIDGQFKYTNKVKAVKLPQAGPKAGTSLTVSAYGEPDFYGDLRKGSMNYITNTKCKNIYKKKAQWTFTDRMSCVYNPGKVTLCDGEWAAPAVKNNILYSIMSMYDPTPSECESTAHPTLMADISTVVPWITQVTGIKP